ncbi:DUF2167 domain-containing protein [Massilia buxea]|nr:DUF2167 domain-containing protein [Pseudoduganella buxea]
MLCLALTTAAVQAAAPAEPAAASASTAAALLDSLKFQQGKITLPGDIATLDLPAGFRYLSPADAGRLLTEGWGNPPGIETLGMIVPTAVNPLSREGWGVVVTYEKEGHVKDDDADSIKYDELLKSMQESIAASNEERKKQGYQPMTLVGWAEAPHYDKATHKLYWAKELHGEGDTQNGLNYGVRVLGREGVLVLNAVAGMDQIAQVRSEMKNVTAFSDFTPGNRYADFDEKTDKVAEYGIAALIAGGAAAKLGLFGKLFALVLAFKKILLVGLLAAGGWLFKLLGRKSKVDLGKRG